MTPLEFTLLAAVVSVAAGFLRSILGLGGGIIVIPALTLWFHIDIRYANRGSDEYDVYLRVSGLDALVAELRARGADIMDGPEDLQRGGARLRRALEGHLMHWGWLWGAVLLAVGLLDGGIRLATGWSMVWVVRAEATLLLAASVGLLMLHWHRPARGRGRMIQVGLAASLALGGLRAALWALGMPVPRANLVIAILAVVGGALALWRRRTPTVALALVALLACGQAPRQATSDTPAPRAVPVYREPRHRLVFQSALARVLDVRIGPGDTTAYHIHADPMVGIAIQDARIRIQSPGSPLGAVASPRATPYVFDNWSQALPYTHRVVNTDTLPLHYVVAEWLARSGPEAPALLDDANRHLVKEGPTTRVYQVTLAPGTATEPHIHATPGLVVLATAGSLQEEGGGRAEGGTGAGRWSWREPTEPHVLRNGGTTHLIIYEIDWR